MSKVAKAFQFTDEPYQLEQPGQIRREATRWLFFGGDVISADRKVERDLEDPLRHGGEELPTRCLVVTRGFVPRCFLSPLMIGGEVMPEELVPETIEFFQIRPGDGEVSALGAGYSSALAGSQLVATKVYPGHEINSLLLGPANVTGGLRKGIVELKALAGVEWADARTWDLQNFFFPGWPNIPRTIEGVREGLEKRFVNVDTAPKHSVLTANDVTSLVSDKLESLRLFEAWARFKLDEEHTLLKAGRTDQGHVYTYSPLGILLLEQLGLKRQEQQVRQGGEEQLSASDIVHAIREGNGGGGRKFTIEDLRAAAENDPALVQSLKDLLGIKK